MVYLQLLSLLETITAKVKLIVNVRHLVIRRIRLSECDLKADRYAIGTSASYPPFQYLLKSSKPLVTESGGRQSQVEVVRWS